jgi:hypothetical protein
MTFIRASTLLLLAGCATAPSPTRPGVPAASAVATTGPERAPSRDIHQICAENPEVGIYWCEVLAAGDPSDCVQMCVEEHHSSRPPQPPAPAPPQGTKAAVASPASAAPPSSPSDAYFFALADCVRRARDSHATSSCRLSSPVDEADLGQNRCNARCAKLAGTAVASRP